MKSIKLMLDGENLKLKDLKSILLGNLHVEIEIDEFAKHKISQSRDVVDMIVAKKIPIYGISTGFGKFKEIYIAHKDMIDLQKNLIISHATCVGEPLPPNLVMIMLILRLNCLIRGFSGVRMELIEKLSEAIAKQILPKVPQQGSVGASGDLAPLSHLALGLMGIGEIWMDGKFMDAEQVFQIKDFVPIQYLEKEGLAMNNGTQMMAALNLESMLRASYIMNAADLALTLSSFALKCDYSSLPNLDNLKKLIGELPKNEKKINPKSIQTAFTAHKCVRDQLEQNLKILEREINSTSDNPIIDVVQATAKSGGNFHGEYMAILADNLCIALQRLCIFSERRQERLVNSEIGQCGLPMFLTKNGGILNGYMIPQYTSAALVSENKVLSHPSCVDTVPTSANIEDHVSMGAYSARKAQQVAKNAEYIIAIELMCAIQAIEYRSDVEELPQKINQILQYFRKIVPSVSNQDIFMAQHIEQVAKEIRQGYFDELLDDLLD